MEKAVHVPRLVLAGTLDRYLRRQLIIGHMGETLPVMMARCDMTMPQKQTRLTRAISQMLRNQVHLTTSGIFTRPPPEAALATFGVDRILFLVDYPYAENAQGRQFLDGLVPPAEVEKRAYGNADQLLKLQ
ncbi:amidohydrolase family protein [Hymenobacter terricola]|uniref:amidohydrolase family protein n=1 Tax=Hymenobacter terricola TaxID=2819236 RepID=UPI001B3070AB